MARAGEVIENPVHRVRIVFRKTAKDTGGRSVEMDFIMAPGGQGGGAHIHAVHEERVQVLSGTFRATVGRDERRTRPGEVIVFPAGSVHDLRNDGPEPAHAILEVRPGWKAEAMFETICGLGRDGKLNRKGRPSLLQAAVLAREYRVFGPRPAVAVQKPGIAVLAAVGRLLGYRPRYPEYSEPGS